MTSLVSRSGRVSNEPARNALEEVGFAKVIEAGLGVEPTTF